MLDVFIEVVTYIFFFLHCGKRSNHETRRTVNIVYFYDFSLRAGKNSSDTFQTNAFKLSWQILHFYVLWI